MKNKVFNRKVYIYKSLFDFFSDEIIITDFLKAFYALYMELINNEVLLDNLYFLIRNFDGFIKKIDDKKIVIRIYDYDNIIELDDKILGFFGLEEPINNLTKMPNFSPFLNVFLFLLIKKINEKFGANNYDEFEEKWKEYVYNINGLDLDTKCFFVSNNIYICYIPRLYYLFF